MTEQEILEKLNVLFRQIFDDQTLALTPATTAEDIEEWDSFNHVSIIVGVESEFKIKFQTAEIEGLKNVGDFVKAIERKLRAQAA